jgi:hypothetical protein
MPTFPTAKKDTHQRPSLNRWFFCACQLRENPAITAEWWHSLALATWWIHGTKPGTGGYMETERSTKEKTPLYF